MVTLVRLETWSDYVAQTTDEVYYWSTVPLRYSWDGVTDHDWERRVADITPVIRGFPHIPDASELAIRDGITITLDASERAGNYLWNDLDATNLLGAKVEIATLLVDVVNGKWWDQTALGVVHTVRLRGEVARRWQDGWIRLELRG